MKSVTLKSRIVSWSTTLAMSSSAQPRGTQPRVSSGLLPKERLWWVHLQPRASLWLLYSQSPQVWQGPIRIHATHRITSVTGTLYSRIPSTSLLSVSISHCVFFYGVGAYTLLTPSVSKTNLGGYNSIHYIHRYYRCPTNSKGPRNFNLASKHHQACWS